tara:strand:+ start:2172 stop:2474 length:303 start_codon:yes stop_codon:yes gene_type:complete
LKNKTVIDQLFRSKVFIVQNEIKVSRDNGKEDPPFFCVSVPKKYFSRAVDRNKIKRRIKSALNNININLSGCFLITYKNLNMMSYQKIEKTLTDIFKISN